MRNLYRINWDACEHTGCMCAIHEHENHTQVESTKLERKLRDALNRIFKLIPSVRRISELDRIAVELEAEATQLESTWVPYSSPEGLRADALYLKRLEYDLTSMREAKAALAPKKETTMRASSKYESSQWLRGERP